MQYLNFFKQVDSNGQISKTLIQINAAVIDQKVGFQKLMLNVLNNYVMKNNEIQDNDYPLAPDKIETKKEILSCYQLNIADFCNIPIGNVKK